MTHQKTNNPEHSQPSNPNFWNRHRRAAALTTLAGVAVHLAGCSDPVPTDVDVPKPTQPSATSAQRGEAQVDWDNLDATVAVNGKKLKITPKARAKTKIEDVIPVYFEWSSSPYAQENYTGIPKLIKKVHDPEVQAQAADLYAARVIDDLDGLSANLETYDSEYNDADNEVALGRVGEAIDAITNPELAIKARRIVDLEIAEALVAGDYDKVTEGTEKKLLAEISDAKLAELTKQAMAGDDDAADELKKRLEDEQEGTHSAELEAWYGLYKGSSAHAEQINRDREEYFKGAAGAKDKTLPAAKSTLLDLAYGVEQISSESKDYEEKLAAIRSQIDAAVKKYPELVSIAQRLVDADLAKQAENEYMTHMQYPTSSTNPEKLAGHIERSEARVGDIRSDDIKKLAGVALDIDQAKMLEDGKISKTVAEMILDSIQDPKIKKLAKQASAGNELAEKKLEEIDTTVYDAINQQENRSFHKLFSGSNTHATSINSSIEAYQKNK